MSQVRQAYVIHNPKSQSHLGVSISSTSPVRSLQQCMNALTQDPKVSSLLTAPHSTKHIKIKTIIEGKESNTYVIEGEDLLEGHTIIQPKKPKDQEPSSEEGLSFGALGEEGSSSSEVSGRKNSTALSSLIKVHNYSLRKLRSASIPYIASDLFTHLFGWVGSIFSTSTAEMHETAEMFDKLNHKGFLSQLRFIQHLLGDGAPEESNSKKLSDILAQSLRVAHLMEQAKVSAHDRIALSDTLDQIEHEIHLFARNEEQRCMVIPLTQGEGRNYIPQFLVLKKESDNRIIFKHINLSSETLKTNNVNAVNTYISNFYVEDLSTPVPAKSIFQQALSSINHLFSSVKKGEKIVEEVSKRREFITCLVLSQSMGATTHHIENALAAPGGFDPNALPSILNNLNNTTTANLTANLNPFQIFKQIVNNFTDFNQGATEEGDFVSSLLKHYGTHLKEEPVSRRASSDPIKLIYNLLEEVSKENLPDTLSNAMLGSKSLFYKNYVNYLIEYFEANQSSYTGSERLLFLKGIEKYAKRFNKYLVKEAGPGVANELTSSLLRSIKEQKLLHQNREQAEHLHIGVLSEPISHISFRVRNLENTKSAKARKKETVCALNKKDLLPKKFINNIKALREQIAQIESGKESVGGAKSSFASSVVALLYAEHKKELLDLVKEKKFAQSRSYGVELLKALPIATKTVGGEVINHPHPFWAKMSEEEAQVWFQNITTTIHAVQEAAILSGDFALNSEEEVEVHVVAPTILNALYSLICHSKREHFYTHFLVDYKRRPEVIKQLEDHLASLIERRKELVKKLCIQDKAKAWKREDDAFVAEKKEYDKAKRKYRDYRSAQDKVDAHNADVNAHNALLSPNTRRLALLPDPLSCSDPDVGMLYQRVRNQTLEQWRLTQLTQRQNGLDNDLKLKLKSDFLLNHYASIDFSKLDLYWDSLEGEVRGHIARILGQSYGQTVKYTKELLAYSTFGTQTPLWKELLPGISFNEGLEDHLFMGKDAALLLGAYPETLHRFNAAKAAFSSWRDVLSNSTPQAQLHLNLHIFKPSVTSAHCQDLTTALEELCEAVTCLAADPKGLMPDEQAKHNTLRNAAYRTIDSNLNQRLTGINQNLMVAQRFKNDHPFWNRDWIERQLRARQMEIEACVNPSGSGNWDRSQRIQYYVDNATEISKTLYRLIWHPDVNNANSFALMYVGFEGMVSFEAEEGNQTETSQLKKSKNLIDEGLKGNHAATEGWKYFIPREIESLTLLQHMRGLTHLEGSGAGTYSGYIGPIHTSLDKKTLKKNITSNFSNSLTWVYSSMAAGWVLVDKTDRYTFMGGICAAYNRPTDFQPTTSDHSKELGGMTPSDQDYHLLDGKEVSSLNQREGEPSKSFKDFDTKERYAVTSVAIGDDQKQSMPGTISECLQRFHQDPSLFITPEARKHIYNQFLKRDLLLKFFQQNPNYFKNNQGLLKSIITEMQPRSNIDTQEQHKALAFYIDLLASVEQSARSLIETKELDKELGESILRSMPAIPFRGNALAKLWGIYANTEQQGFYAFYLLSHFLRFSNQGILSQYDYSTITNEQWILILQTYHFILYTSDQSLHTASKRHVIERFGKTLLPFIEQKMREDEEFRDSCLNALSDGAKGTEWSFSPEQDYVYFRANSAGGIAQKIDIALGEGYKLKISYGKRGELPLALRNDERVQALINSIRLEPKTAVKKANLADLFRGGQATPAAHREESIAQEELNPMTDIEVVGEHVTYSWIDAHTGAKYTILTKAITQELEQISQTWKGESYAFQTVKTGTNFFAKAFYKHNKLIEGLLDKYGLWVSTKHKDRAYIARNHQNLADDPIGVSLSGSRITSAFVGEKNKKKFICNADSKHYLNLLGFQRDSKNILFLSANGKTLDEIRFPEEMGGLRLLLNAKGEWVAAGREHLQWQLTDTAILEERFGKNYRSFLLPLKNSETGEYEFWAWPHVAVSHLKQDAEVTYIKAFAEMVPPPFSQTGLQPLRFGMNSKGEPFGSHGAFLYIAFNAFLQGDNARAASYLQAAERHGTAYSLQDQDACAVVVGSCTISLLLHLASKKGVNSAFTVQQLSFLLKLTLLFQNNINSVLMKEEVSTENPLTYLMGYLYSQYLSLSEKETRLLAEQGLLLSLEELTQLENQASPIIGVGVSLALNELEKEGRAEEVIALKVPTQEEILKFLRVSKNLVYSPGRLSSLPTVDEIHQKYGKDPKCETLIANFWSYFKWIDTRAVKYNELIFLFKKISPTDSNPAEVDIARRLLLTYWHYKNSEKFTLEPKKHPDRGGASEQVLYQGLNEAQAQNARGIYSILAHMPNFLELSLNSRSSVRDITSLAKYHLQVQNFGEIVEEVREKEVRTIAGRFGWRMGVKVTASLLYIIFYMGRQMYFNNHEAKLTSAGIKQDTSLVTRYIESGNSLLWHICKSDQNKPLAFDQDLRDFPPSDGNREPEVDIVTKILSGRGDLSDIINPEAIDLGKLLMSSFRGLSHLYSLKSSEILETTSFDGTAEDRAMEQFFEKSAAAYRDLVKQRLQTILSSLVDSGEGANLTNMIPDLTSIIPDFEGYITAADESQRRFVESEIKSGIDSMLELIESGNDSTIAKDDVKKFKEAMFKSLEEARAVYLSNREKLLSDLRVAKQQRENIASIYQERFTTEASTFCDKPDQVLTNIEKFSEDLSKTYLKYMTAQESHLPECLKDVDLIIGDIIKIIPLNSQKELQVILKDKLMTTLNEARSVYLTDQAGWLSDLESTKGHNANVSGFSIKDSSEIIKRSSSKELKEQRRWLPTQVHSTGRTKEFWEQNFFTQETKVAAEENNQVQKALAIYPVAADSGLSQVEITENQRKQEGILLAYEQSKSHATRVNKLVELEKTLRIATAQVEAEVERCHKKVLELSKLHARSLGLLPELGTLTDQEILLIVLRLYEKGELNRVPLLERQIDLEYWITQFLLASSEQHQLAKAEISRKNLYGELKKITAKAAREKPFTLMPESTEDKIARIQEYADTSPTWRSESDNLHLFLTVGSDRLRYANKVKGEENVWRLKDPSLSRKYLLFDYRNKLVARPKAIAAVENILYRRSQVEKVRMGMGKTTFIDPTLAQLFIEKGLIPILITTEPLVHQLKQGLPPDCFEFKFDYKYGLTTQETERGMRALLGPGEDLNNLSEERSREIKNKLHLNVLKNLASVVSGVQKSKHVVITSPNSIGWLRDERVLVQDELLKLPEDAVKEKGQLMEKLELLKSIEFFFRGRRDTVFIVDEDSNVDISKEFNIAGKQGRQVDSIRFKMAEKIALTLLANPEHKKLLIVNEARGIIDYKSVLRDVAESILIDQEFWKSIAPQWFTIVGNNFNWHRQISDGLFRKELIKYLLGEVVDPPEAMPTWREGSHDQLGLKHLSALKGFLSNTFRDVYGVNGHLERGLCEKDGMSVVPYQEGHEKENTRYGVESEIILHTIFHYIALCPSEEAFYKLYNQISKSVDEQWDEWSQKIISKSAEFDNDKYAAISHPSLWRERLMLLGYVVANRPEIRIYDEQVMCNCQEITMHAALSQRLFVNSGTGDPYSMNLLKPPEDSAEGSSANSLEELSSIIEELSSMPKSFVNDPDDVLGETVLKLDLDAEVELIVDPLNFVKEKAENPKVCSVINLDYEILHNDSQKIANALAQGAVGSQRQFAYRKADPKEGRTAWLESQGTALPYRRERVDVDTLFSYFGVADGRGVDFKQPTKEGTVSYVMAGLNTPEDTLLQGAWRNRELGRGQNVRFACDAKLATRIRKSQNLNDNVKITTAHLLNDIKVYTLKKQEVERLKAAFFKTNVIIKEELDIELITPYGSKDPAFIALDNVCFKAVRDYYISKQDIDWQVEYCGQKKEETLRVLQAAYQSSIDNLGEVIKQLEEGTNQFWNSNKGLKEEVLGLCTSRLNTLKQVLQRAQENLGNAKNLLEKREIKEFHERYLPKETPTTATNKSNTEMQQQQQQQQQQQLMQQIQQQQIESTLGFNISSNQNIIKFEYELFIHSEQHEQHPSFYPLTEFTDGYDPISMATRSGSYQRKVPKAENRVINSIVKFNKTYISDAAKNFISCNNFVKSQLYLLIVDSPQGRKSCIVTHNEYHNNLKKCFDQDDKNVSRDYKSAVYDLSNSQAGPMIMGSTRYLPTRDHTHLLIASKLFLGWRHFMSHEQKVLIETLGTLFLKSRPAFKALMKTLNNLQNDHPSIHILKLVKRTLSVLDEDAFVAIIDRMSRMAAKTGGPLIFRDINLSFKDEADRLSYLSSLSVEQFTQFRVILNEQYRAAKAKNLRGKYTICNHIIEALSLV